MNDQDDMDFNERKEVLRERPIISNTINATNSIEKILSQSINLNNEYEIHEPTCIICSSPLRKEAEGLYNSKPVKTDFKPIVDLFSDKGCVKVGVDVVKNHMKFHIDSGREIQKVEYVNRLQRLRGQTTTTLNKIDMTETVLLERLTGINSLVAETDRDAAEIEKIKSTESCRVVSQLSSLFKLRANIMGEMKTSGDLIQFAVNYFIKTLADTLRDNAKTDRERELIKTLLEKLKMIGS